MSYSKMDPKFKIAYWLTDKKKSKLKIDELEQLLKQDYYHLIRIQSPEDFETKGPFSVFFHKLTDITINLSNLNENMPDNSPNYNSDDKEMKIWIQKYKDCINQYPWMRVLDPLSKIEAMLDRNRQYQLAVQNKNDEDSFFFPTFIELKKKDKALNIKLLKENNVNYPIICKPLIAHGCTLAHQMSLVFSENGLDDIRPPCVAQTFINHSAKLYKLFVLKKQYFLVERPSLKNFEAGNFPTVHFDTHQISKMNSACELNTISEEDQLRLRNRELKKEMLDRIVESMGQCFGLTFFGVDVIIEDKTGNYMVIDINNFPAYDGVPNFPSLFKDLLIEESNIAMSLYQSGKNASLNDQKTDSKCSSLNGSYTTSHQVVANSIYSRICQWFYTLNKKVN